MAQLDRILRQYAAVRIRKTWKTPSKWFEEIIKLLLADTFVRNAFNEEVERFVFRYRTGGGKPDILIPVREGEKKATVWVIDTKHWEKDFYKALGSGKEKPTKYIAYVDKKNPKSRPLRKLIKLLRKSGIEKVSLHLVFIQRASGYHEPNIPELAKHYHKVIIIGLDKLLQILKQAAIVR